MSAASLWARSLNHLIRQNPGAADLLRQHVGQTMRFDLGITTFDLRIENDGSLVEAATTSPDAVLRTTANLLTRLPFLGADAFRHADYSGNAELLQTLDKVLSGLRWDIEADLAPLLGDVIAHRLTRGGQDAVRTLRHAGHSIQISASEYLVEEVALLARKMDVEYFTHAVDQVVDDISRLEARLARLESNVAVNPVSPIQP